MMFQTERLAEAKPPNRSLIVFHRYGDSYFLSEILTAGQQVGGSELFPSRAERQLNTRKQSDSKQQDRARDCGPGRSTNLSRSL
jgi:hypothetical protein